VTSEKPSTVASVRLRSREFLRAELATAANNLFAEHGFENVTIDAIAAATGMSRRTFFRYFPTKEDVVFGSLQVLSQDIAEELASRPSEESAWDALRAALHVPLRRIVDNPDRTLQLYQMLERTPALQSARGAKQRRRHDQLSPMVRDRLLAQKRVPRARADIAANALVGAALSCLDTALKVWSGSDGKRNAEKLLDTAMKLVAEGATDTAS
jgi:AcrR family transcriptional regulator